MKYKKRVEYIDSNSKKMKIIILDSRNKEKKVPGVLWIHGGGYIIGTSKMVYISRGKDIVKNFETVVISPHYRLATKEPYPAALNDCYNTLVYMYENADKLGIDRENIIVGGESAGGGLCIATCIYARDKGKVKVKFQMPLYPMIDCDDTETSKDNHGYIWNTKRNHKGWKKYLGDLYGSKDVSEYASPAKLKDFKNLPPLYTFVTDGEPFYKETIDFVNKAKENGIKAEVDIYHSKVHSFDMILPFRKISKEARKKLLEKYEQAIYKD